MRLHLDDDAIVIVERGHPFLHFEVPCDFDEDGEPIYAVLQVWATGDIKFGA